MSLAQTITEAFEGEWHGDWGSIPTPGHSVKDRGTTVKDGDDGGVLFHSFNGGDWKAVKAECERRGLLPPWNKPEVGPEWRCTGAYEYADALGAITYRTRRLERVGEPKRFVAERAVANGWQPKLGDVERVPYRLPELIAADPAKPIYFVEGERKADKLVEMGFVATAIPFGAKGWRIEYAQRFKDRTVIILPDNDEPGREFAAKVRAAINAVGTAVCVELPDLPPKGDIVDWGGSADELRALSAVALTSQRQTFPLADLIAWSSSKPAPKDFLMERFIPAGEVTLASGPGGSNKSTFGEQLATCSAAGLPMLGVPVRQGQALYVTAEDGEDRLHWSQAHICARVGVRMEDLAGKLHLASLRGRLGNELATFDNSGRMVVASAFALLKETVAATQAKLVVLDNVAHLFTGNENDRGQVTAFINLLYSLCLEFRTTVLLIAHPNKAGDTYSGSTAWLNSVRSQITISRPEESIDPDERILSLGKANYSRPGETLAFRWHDFALVTEAEIPINQRAEMAATLQATADNELFLSCLAERNRQGRHVSEKTGANFAPAIFADMPESKRIGNARLRQAMDRLFRIGAIERAVLGRDSAKGRDIVGLKKADGLPQTPPPNASQTVPQAYPEHTPHAPQTPPHTHAIPKGISGAAFGSAAPVDDEIVWDEGEGDDD